MAYLTIEDLNSTGHDLSQLNDIDLNDIILTATSIINTYCGQSFENTIVKNEIYPSTCYRETTIFTEYNPIISVEKIQLVNSYSKIIIDLNNIIIDNIRKSIYILTPVVFNNEYVVIDYTYGYTELPETIKGVAKLLCSLLLDRYTAAKISGFADATTLQEYQEKIIRNPVAYKDFLALLDSYKRV